MTASIAATARVRPALGAQRGTARDADANATAPKRLAKAAGAWLEELSLATGAKPRAARHPMTRTDLSPWAPHAWTPSPMAPPTAIPSPPIPEPRPLAGVAGD